MTNPMSARFSTIATASVVLLVAIVLLFGGRTWAEGRQGAQVEHAYLELLESDLNVSIQVFEAEVDSTRERIRAATQWDAWLNDEAMTGSASLMESLQVLATLPSWDPPRRAFAELSLSSVRTIEDPELRQAMIAFYERMDRLTGTRFPGHQALQGRLDVHLDPGEWRWVNGHEVENRPLDYRATVKTLYETELRGPIRAVLRDFTEHEHEIRDLRQQGLDLWSMVRARLEELR